ncbi:MAG: hypothetical protein DMG31_01780 [Acidobacteria bacterium]|nr:MAG: hypothetical protein DMG31_01780 [Acidobacteriota bacterium]
MKPQFAKSNVRRGQSLTGPKSPADVNSGVRSPRWSCDWIPSLAEPYLRGYASHFESGNSLLGCRFLAQRSAVSPPSGKKVRSAASEKASAGFFIGYLLDHRGLPFLKSTPPEFLVFCFIEPLGGRLHRRLVSEPDSLMRGTAEYIRWLTHHPPRFELFTEEKAALVRHVPTQQWPASRIEHYARNFAIETLAWLVRSALVRRLPREITASSHPASKRRAARK